MFTDQIIDVIKELLCFFKQRGSKSTNQQLEGITLWETDDDPQSYDLVYRNCEYVTSCYIMLHNTGN